MSATLASPFSVLAPEESEAARPCPSPGGPRHTARLTSSSLEGPKLLGRHTFPLQKAPRRPALVSPPSRGPQASGPPVSWPPAPQRGPRSRPCPAPTAGHGRQHRNPIARLPSPPARPSPWKRFLPARPQPMGELRQTWRARPQPEGPMRAGRAGRRCLPPWWAVEPGWAGGTGVLGRV